MFKEKKFMDDFEFLLGDDLRGRTTSFTDIHHLPVLGFGVIPPTSASLTSISNPLVNQQSLRNLLELNTFDLGLCQNLSKLDRISLKLQCKMI